MRNKNIKQHDILEIGWLPYIPNIRQHTYWINVRGIMVITIWIYDIINFILEIIFISFSLSSVPFFHLFFFFCCCLLIPTLHRGTIRQQKHQRYSKLIRQRRLRWWWWWEIFFFSGYLLKMEHSFCVTESRREGKGEEERKKSREKESRKIIKRQCLVCEREFFLCHSSFNFHLLIFIFIFIRSVSVSFFLCYVVISYFFFFGKSWREEKNLVPSGQSINLSMFQQKTAWPVCDQKEKKEKKN